jgi:hypothetical protein
VDREDRERIDEADPLAMALIGFSHYSLPNH